MRHRIGYWYLIAVGLLLVLFGIVDVLSGVSADPAITVGLGGLSLDELRRQDPIGYDLHDFTTRSQGLALSMGGGLLAAIAWIPYRRAQRWSWLAVWVLPAWCLASTLLFLVHGLAPDATVPPPMISGPILGGLAVAVLLADRATFFGDEPTTT